MQLGRQAANGDVSGSDDTYRLYFPRIRNMISHKFGENPPSEDITQDAFLKAYAVIEAKKFEYKNEHGLYGWISRIAINRAIDLKRKQGRIIMTPVDFSDGSYEQPAPRDFTEDIAAADSAMSMLGALSPERREALVAVDIRGEKYEEYADRRGINLGTVRSRIHRARKDLRQNLLEQDSTE
jgi:RNA polymerase sigma-70 factor, ECF subfamily